MDLGILIFDSRQTSPLLWASEHKNFDLVRLFLNRGADANSPDSAAICKERPTLIKAAEKGNRKEGPIA